ncbi:MAG: hypothetical protein A3H70_02295 [Candidatus Komeilibacteria bacterium RIFCSPLOWO2_02_FULL_48_11]|uniref:SpoVT-AbrB domain-containing protein n=1 Tax=Candidatus Komeilibacteria bacterium RIFCSPLOWO2_02_FULL_48_11 TaxID=1798553 RepID=A0A1G2BV19_9BACT|nr:MAG: hypothetical protein A3H70_02295 [Candidatus Komeilibacteria bacterium RIFCSPLOWO2_02_FULL_48_11]
MDATVTKIKDGTITLPRQVSKSWSNKDVLIFSDDSRVIIEPIESEWEQFEKNAENAKQDISLELIDEAVQWAKKKRS